MEKQLKKYKNFVGEVMAVEYATTILELTSDFKELDKDIFTIVEKANKKEVGETLEIVLNIIDDFKDVIEEKIKDRLKTIIEDKKPELVNTMSEIAIECDDILESLIIVEPMKKITDSAFEMYGTMCIDFISKKLYNLMNEVEERLGIREEMSTIEKLLDNEEVDISEVLELISKM